MTDDIQRKDGQGERKVSKAEEYYHTERKRTSVKQYRSKMEVAGKDPNFEYRWVLDKKDSGAEIQRRMTEDWALVRAEELDRVGADNIFRSKFAGGSIVRLPSGSDGVFYYLMKIRKEWYQADQAEKQKAITEREQGAFKANSKDERTGEDTYDAIAGPKGINSGSRVEGVTIGQ